MHLNTILVFPYNTYIIILAPIHCLNSAVIATLHSIKSYINFTIISKTFIKTYAHA